MANMFFAGIPLEGSGARPLDADLYGADQQNVDQENLAGTGNLNIGNLIQYDEHMQRYLNGASLGGEQESRGTMQLTTHNLTAQEDAVDNNSVFFSGPAANSASIAPAQASEMIAPNYAARTSGEANDNAPQAGAPNAASTGIAGDGTPDSSDTSTVSSSTTSTVTDNSTTTTNTYNTTTTTNNYYDNDVVNTPQELIPAPVIELGDTVINEATDLLSQLTDTAGDTVNTVNNLGDVLNGAGNGLLEQVVETAGGVINNTDGTLQPVIDIVNGATANTDGLLQPVIDIANDMTGDAVGNVDAMLQPIIDTVTDSGLSLLDPLVAPAQDLFQPVVDIMNDAAGGVLTSTMPVLNTGIDTIESTLPDITAPLEPVIATATELAAPVVDPALDLVGDALGGNMLLDANLGVVNDPIAAADNNALINIDGGLFSPSDSTPDASGSGLVNLDMSAFSSPVEGSGAQDGMSLGLNLNALGDISPIDMPSMPLIPQVDIPLPATESVPFAQTSSDIFTDGGTSVQDTTDGMLDSVITLGALGDNTSQIAAIDTGILFTGTSTTAGSGSSTPAPAHDFNIGNLLGSTLFGGHH